MGTRENQRVASKELGDRLLRERLRAFGGQVTRPGGRQAPRLLSHSPGLAVGLGLGALAEVAKKSLLGGRLPSGE